ncbi:SpoIIE family protein phosphatase [Magnetospirillum sp. 64-120]|uniref:ATP-binding SpoIIE family protein phosphatase n=1 Tax=Magnetospirillum sp. 64-120 TaxID=1895778 RepID=UPI0025C368D2|nr:SpoIIE family protein phosphatase [Magnetospirillum sp. 64-120]
MAQPETVSADLSRPLDWSWATVMVVDDEEINRELLAGIARRQGVGTVVQAKDGLDCLHQLERTAPDLIILDIVMPNQDGFTTCSRIRQIPQWADIPILVQTALTSPQDVLACFEAGASDVVAKPIRPAELSARIRVHLENRRMMGTLRDANLRIHREMQGAREMQRTLLPSRTVLDDLRTRHGLWVEGRVEPLDGVGGDIWNIVPLSDTLIAVMLADFSGHGLMAALNTFWLHAFITRQTEAMRQPADFLKLLNSALRENLMRGHFATFFFGLIDLERDEMHWSGAGAPKPVLTLGGEHFQLDTTGLPLGLTDRAVYTSHSVAFPPGAGLLLFSDGLTDVDIGDGQKMESHGLVSRLEGYPSSIMDADLNNLWDTILPPGTGHLTDDTTAVWIRRQRLTKSDRQDNRFLSLAGIGTEPAKLWVAQMALPTNLTPPGGIAGRPIHLVASGLDEALATAFTTPFALIVEANDDLIAAPPPEELLQPPGDNQIMVSMTTATAYRLPLAMLFTDALFAQGLIAEAAKGGILLALQEAVANSVVHGNLELHSPRRAFENMRAYWAEIRSRLADPIKANRLITLDARIRDALIAITVTDQGRGYNPDMVQSRDPSRPHGKGLKLISQLALSRDVTQGGRQHVLTFARDRA